ncbi:MAG TPA: alpha-L-fucosidase [Opitutaceae bacterium]|nr:alpha-L-fucosidase [Opitutaceae bacterium]
MTTTSRLWFAVCLGACAAAGFAGAADNTSETARPAVVVSTAEEPVAFGPFAPTWESLAHYQVPAWFRDAKFGIWAHWGPQCQPEEGDWYARNMYIQGNRQYESHLQHYGPPSRSGFKDIIRDWRAEHWDPEQLVALYKRAGAQYFMALADHEDNFDLWDSKYQPWNSVNLGPRENIIARWAQAARAEGLRFGVSVHCSHAWTWYEPAQGADRTGLFAGVPYDGRLTKADGRGQWWDGYDPQDLYAQNHPRSADPDDPHSVSRQWNWGAGASQPDAAYCEKFYNRAMDLINRYHPDLVYFDDTALPLWPVSDAGLKLAANFYNRSLQEHGGRLEAVLFGKGLDDFQRRCLVWDFERGRSSRIEAQPWQCDTCIGQWHYWREIYEQHRYKSAPTVLQMLADVVSKNGNLLLSIPVRGDGTIDDDERHIVESIAAWMDVNRECIFGTRPWRICGEGPSLEDAAALNERRPGGDKPQVFTGADIRFTTKGDTLYAIIMAWPADHAVSIKSLGGGAPDLGGRKITGVALLGDRGHLDWTQGAAGLRVTLPAQPPCAGPVVLKIAGALPAP